MTSKPGHNISKKSEASNCGQGFEELQRPGGRAWPRAFLGSTGQFQGLPLSLALTWGLGTGETGGAYLPPRREPDGRPGLSWDPEDPEGTEEAYLAESPRLLQPCLGEGHLGCRAPRPPCPAEASGHLWRKTSSAALSDPHGVTVPRPAVSNQSQAR